MQETTKSSMRVVKASCFPGTLRRDKTHQFAERSAREVEKWRPVVAHVVCLRFPEAPELATAVDKLDTPESLLALNGIIGAGATLEIVRSFLAPYQCVSSDREPRYVPISRTRLCCWESGGSDRGDISVQEEQTDPGAGGLAREQTAELAQRQAEDRRQAGRNMRTIVDRLVALFFPNGADIAPDLDKLQDSASLVKVCDLLVSHASLEAIRSFCALSQPERQEYLVLQPDGTPRIKSFAEDWFPETWYREYARGFAEGRDEVRAEQLPFLRSIVTQAVRLRFPEDAHTLEPELDKICDWDSLMQLRDLICNEASLDEVRACLAQFPSRE